jgi:hypothetical protein
MRRTFREAAQRSLNAVEYARALPGNVELLILGPLEARVEGRTADLGAPRRCAGSS